MIHFLITSLVSASLVFNTNALSDTNRDIIQNKIIDLARECFLENKITATDIISLGNLKLPSDSDVSCFLGCLFKKLKMVDNDGKVTPLKAKEAASSIVEDVNTLNNIERLVSHCSSVSEKTTNGQCVGSFNLFTCFVENKEKFDLTIKFKKHR